MSDIFISYARSTEAQAKLIGDALRALGHGVWRDDELPAHRSFAEVIEERLRAAKAVVVVWSAEAVKSEWVQAEADRARTDRKLVQLSVDGAVPPIPFDRIQCVDMAEWAGEASHPGWRRVLASIDELAGAPAATSGAAAAASATPEARGNLPHRQVAIIGREAELAQITALLEESDLVTVTGTGGVGKTRIVVEVGLAQAGRFKDGAWLVELAPVADPDQVTAAVGRAMGLELPGGEEARGALIERLGPRACLIILDNCEHLIDAVAALAEDLMEGAPNVKLLASSQELLGVAGEQVFRLRSLAAAAAAKLFAERAHAADAEFRIANTDKPTVAAICRRLDGIPLAIEMAAARAPALGCKELLQRLDDRFRLLTGGRRTALPRQRTLVAALDWSHDLLSERDAAVFRGLGVFSGGFTLEAARSVCASERWDSLEVAEAVTSLVAKSLVTTETAWGARRYRLLETTRAYALEKLAVSGETQATLRAHADYFRELAAQSVEDYWLRPVSDEAFAERYLAEVDNDARASDWAFGPEGDVQGGIQLTADTMGMMWARTLYAEFAARAEQAVARLNAQTPPAVRARLFAVQAFAHMMISATAMAGLAERAIEACRADGDALSLFIALRARSIGLSNLKRDQEVVGLRDDIVAMADHFPSPSRVAAQIKFMRWFVASMREPQDATVDLLDAAVAELRSFGAEADAIRYRSVQLRYFPSGGMDAAVDEWRTLLADTRRAYALPNLATAIVVGGLMTVLAKRGGPGDLEEATELGRGVTDLDAGAEGSYVLVGLAWIALKTGRAALAGRLTGRLDKITADLGSRSPQRMLFDDLRPALQAELPEVELERVMAEGASLTAEGAHRLVLGD